MLQATKAATPKSDKDGSDLELELTLAPELEVYYDFANGHLLISCRPLDHPARPIRLASLARLSKLFLDRPPNSST